MQAMEIRQAKTSELEAVADLAGEFYSSTRFLRVFDKARFVQLWTGFIEAGTGVIFAIYDGDKVGGAIAGIIYPEAYSGEDIAQEFFWFIRSEYRGTIRSIKLYHEFEAWAREKGASEVRMGHLADLMPDSVASFYRRLGFEEVETNYVKRLAA